MYHEFKGECLSCKAGAVGIGTLPYGGEYAIECDVCNGTGEEEYGSFEVFGVSQLEVNYNLENLDHANEYTIVEAGYYWWACFPGCLPDGEANGPFASEEEAEENARNTN